MPRKYEDGFYWESDFSGRLQAFVEIHPIKIGRINVFYWNARHQETCKLIGELFLQRNVPRLIHKGDKTHLILEHIYDAREDAKLQIWSRLCENPPTHSLVVGYLSGKQRRESVRLVISLRCVGQRQAWAVQLAGRMIARLLSESRDHFLLTRNRSNAEFWLQCVFAVVCDIREG